jgi:hypothetical protein
MVGCVGEDDSGERVRRKRGLSTNIGLLSAAVSGQQQRTVEGSISLGFNVIDRGWKSNPRFDGGVSETFAFISLFHLRDFLFALCILSRQHLSTASETTSK